MNLLLINSSPIPLYEQLKEQIKQGILRGDPAGGELLPSIRSLAQSLSTSVITVKRAYDDLERDGYIFTAPGKGTFVSTYSRGQAREDYLKQLDQQVDLLVEKAQSLGISCRELQALIAEKYGAGKQN
ncbi:MAG: GntR family transcriptional regulator [Peptococcaceae bacterium]|nr:GntR family transcriptional regulator [Peptococcaceae bacterium]